MRKIAVLVLLLVAGVGGYEYYSIFGKPDVTLKTRGTTAVANAAPAPQEEKPLPFIAVAPSTDLVEAFPSTVTVHDGDKTYVARYTGQMRRVKPVFVLPINVYDIASYVIEPKEGETLKLLDGLLVDGATKVYLLRFLNNLPGKKISDDIYDEINETFTDVDVDRLKPSIDKFVTQFKGGSKKGDVVYIVWLPGGKVYSAFNTSDRVHFIGQDVPFARAIWRIWAGPKFGEKRLSLVSRYATNSATK